MALILMLLNGCAGSSKFKNINGKYGLLTDKRNAMAYKYMATRINGKWWTSSNAHIPLPGCSFFPSLKQNPLSDQNEYTYTWQLAQQACPEGWRLPTAEELADLFLAYGKVSYEGNSLYFQEIFGRYPPDSTGATHQALLNDREFFLPFRLYYRYVQKDVVQLTLFWSSHSIGNSAYAVYWDNERKIVQFDAHPQSYFGLCRFVKKEKLSKKQQQALEQRTIRKKQEAETGWRKAIRQANNVGFTPMLFFYFNQFVFPVFLLWWWN